MIIKRILSLTIGVFIFISCSQSGENNGNNNGERTFTSPLDSVRHELSEAINHIERLPAERIHDEFAELDKLRDFFYKTDYTFEREIYLNELSQLEEVHKTFRKTIQALPKLEQEAQYSYNQLNTLEKALKKKQITQEEFDEYFEKERQAVQAFMFEYTRRVVQSENALQQLDTLKPKWYAVKQLAKS